MNKLVRIILVLLRNIRNKVLGFFLKVLPPSIAWGLSSIADRQFYLSALAGEFCSLPILDRHIIYEAYGGRDFAGNPYALFLYLLDHPDYSSFRHVIVSPGQNHPKILKYINNPSVIVVTPDTREYVKFAESCRYFINNSSWKPYLVKRKDQVYVYTWHSTLLKKLARDKGAVWESKNVSRALLCADYFISPNRFTTELLLESHCVASLITASIAEFGYPRNDLLYNSDRTIIREKLKIPDGKKLLVYAPTWRGEYAPENNIRETMCYFRTLSESLDENWHVVIKFHTMVYRFLDRKTIEFCPPLWMDTNELLAAADLLVTDYSGIFYDYLLTGNPLIFFTPDIESYAKAKNGFYINPDNLPGPVARSIKETIIFAENHESIKKKYSGKYCEFLEKYLSEDDGQASARTADLVFMGKVDDRVYTRKDERKKIILYPGNLDKPEIIDFLFSFINTTDFKKFDISVLLDNSFKNRELQGKIAEKAGIFYNEACDSLTREEYFWLSKSFGKNNLFREKNLAEAFKRSIGRVFGNTVFDMAINWQSYDCLSSMRILFGVNTKVRGIFLDRDFFEKFAWKERILNQRIKMLMHYDRIICHDRELTEKLKFYLNKEPLLNKTGKEPVPEIIVTEEIFHG